MGSTHRRGLEMLTGATRDLSETRHVSVTARGLRAPELSGTARSSLDGLKRQDAADAPRCRDRTAFLA